MSLATSQLIVAKVVPGHQVASGQNGNPRFPGGTLRMQQPHFKEQGLDISQLYPGTLNVSIAPMGYRVIRPRHTFKHLKWHPVEPAEDFSFFDVRVLFDDGKSVSGYIYYPHPETKPEHFQAPDILELLLPFMSSISYGATLKLEIPKEQMLFEMPDAC